MTSCPDIVEVLAPGQTTFVSTRFVNPAGKVILIFSPAFKERLVVKLKLWSDDALEAEVLKRSLESTKDVALTKGTKTLVEKRIATIKAAKIS